MEISPETGSTESMRQPDGPSDPDLIAACIRGDALAWQVLIDRYQRLVFSVARRQGLNVDGAEDVLQDVMTALLRQLPTINNRSALAKWLITTTYRTSLLHLSRGRKAVPVSDIEIEAEAIPDPGDWEQKQVVSEALGRLGGRCETLLVALYGHPGRPTYEVIAEQLDMPVGSIGPTRARCLEKLLAIVHRMQGTADPAE